jgi:hypothetical protein
VFCRKIPGEGTARPNAHVQVEQLAHADDRAEVLVALVPQLRRELLPGLALGLRRDGAEQPQLVLSQQLDRLLGKRIPLGNPKAPADVRMHVLGVESNRVERANGLREYQLADAVTRHRNHRVLRHVLPS